MPINYKDKQIKERHKENSLCLTIKNQGANPLITGLGCENNSYV